MGHWAWAQCFALVRCWIAVLRVFVAETHKVRGLNLCHLSSTFRKIDLYTDKWQDPELCGFFRCFYLLNPRMQLRVLMLMCEILTTKMLNLGCTLYLDASKFREYYVKSRGAYYNREIKVSGIITSLWYLAVHIQMKVLCKNAGAVPVVLSLLFLSTCVLFCLPCCDVYVFMYKNPVIFKATEKKSFSQLWDMPLAGQIFFFQVWFASKFNLWSNWLSHGLCTSLCWITRTWVFVQLSICFMGFKMYSSTPMSTSCV